MASNYRPIPAPPRTPTPPTPIPNEDNDDPQRNANSLGIFGSPLLGGGRPQYDGNSLSPMRDQFGSMSQSLYSPANPVDGFTVGSPDMRRLDSESGRSSPAKNPFNFQTQTYTATSPVAKSV